MKNYRDNLRPLIILGMHRSGTSMLARMLETCGLFVGAVLEENHEPPLFRKINDRLLSLAGATWTQPEPYLKRAAEPAFLEECRRTAETMLAQGFGKQFLGLHGARKVLGAPVDAWGWKEPRTCLTLPVWQAIYPQARYVHIVRHPIDVALSLRTRQERKERDGAERWSHPECLDMERNLRLWELYVSAVRSFAERLTTETPRDRGQARRHGGAGLMVELRYEDVLENPLGRLRQLAEHAGLKAAESALEQAAAMAETGRSRRVTDGDPVEAWSAIVRAMPEARRYGYG